MARRVTVGIYSFFLYYLRLPAIFKEGCGQTGPRRDPHGSFLRGEGSFSYHAEGREESHISKDLRNFNPGRMKNRGRD
jgi:hypothetical protein